jgi:hypothetical protein
MATPEIVTVRDYATSRYAQVADNTEGSLSDILARAETAIQTRLGRRLPVTSYVERWRTQSNTLFVKNRPIVAVTQIRRRLNPLHAWEIVDLTYVTINDAAAGYIECYGIYTSNVAGYEVEVTYTAGFSIVPEDIKEAIIMQAVMFSYQDLEIYGSGDSREPGVQYFYEDIDRIIKRYMVTNTVYH